MQRITLAISLVLVMVLSLTACAKEPTAQEIVDNVIESFGNIRTYQFAMDMTQDQAGEAEGMTIELNSSQQLIKRGRKIKWIYQ